MVRGILAGDNSANLLVASFTCSLSLPRCLIAFTSLSSLSTQPGEGETVVGFVARDPPGESREDIRRKEEDEKQADYGLAVQVCPNQFLFKAFLYDLLLLLDFFLKLSKFPPATIQSSFIRH